MIALKLNLDCTHFFPHVLISKVSDSLDHDVHEAPAMSCMTITCLIILTFPRFFIFSMVNYQ